MTEPRQLQRASLGRASLYRVQDHPVLFERAAHAGSALPLQPLSMGNLLRPIAADPHAAPSARTSSSAVGKYQCAGCPLTFFYVGEILFGEDFRHGFADRDEERFR